MAKIVLIINFNGFKTAKRWLCILEKKLSKKLTSAIWLKQTNAQLDRQAAA